MFTLWQDVRFSLRMLARHRGFTATAIAVLALGIGVNAGIFGLINTLLLRPRASDALPGTLVGLLQQGTRNDRRVSCLLVSKLSRPARGGRAVQCSGRAQPVDGRRDRGRYDQACDGRHRIGQLLRDTQRCRQRSADPFTLQEEQPGGPAFVAIASHSEWARTGFAGDILGRPVVLNGRSYTLVGVAPRGFGGTTVVMEPDYYVPLSGARSDRVGARVRHTQDARSA